MWTTEHSIETNVGADAIWRAWADVPRWAEWNGDIDRVELSGPFASGSRIVMIPHGQDPVDCSNPGFERHIDVGSRHRICNGPVQRVRKLRFDLPEAI